MTSRLLSICIVFIAHLPICSMYAQKVESSIEIPEYSATDTILYSTITRLDTEYFVAYNNCDMEKQALFYSDDLEFFHDQAGLNTSKESVLKSIENNICGKVTRILVPGSIEVYPIKDYGAVEIGYHQFFNKEEPNAESIPSKFIILWKEEESGWKITKVISLH